VMGRGEGDAPVGSLAPETGHGAPRRLAGGLDGP
jgi:hypothetical protein